MPVTNYISVNGRMLSEVTDGVILDYVPDALGSIHSVVDQTATAVKTMRYKPYGEVLSRSGSISDRMYQWVGTYGYRTTFNYASSHYIRARHYSQTPGAWTTVDPLWPEENAYGYVKGRGTMSSDPSGLAECGLPDECEPAAFCARNALYDVDEYGNPRFATVLCCKGKKITCVWPKPTWLTPKLRGLIPLPNDDVAECLKKHEDRHHKDCQCKGGKECKVPRDKFEPSECAAHAIDIPCFRSKLNDCVKRAFSPLEKAACLGYYGWWIRLSCDNMRKYDCPNIPKECNKI